METFSLSHLQFQNSNTWPLKNNIKNKQLQLVSPFNNKVRLSEALAVVTLNYFDSISLQMDSFPFGKKRPIYVCFFQRKITGQFSSGQFNQCFLRVYYVSDLIFNYSATQMNATFNGIIQGHRILRNHFKTFLN